MFTDDDDLPDALPGPVRAPGARLNQPWRALVALAELVVAAALLFGAMALWRSGFRPLPLPSGEVTRTLGHRLAGAIGIGTIAVVLTLDALRQLALAVRTRKPRD